MKKVFIMRGLPGSGKSSRAWCLRAERMPTAQTSKVVSADDFFVALGRGAYAFDPTRVGDAHAWCKGIFIDCLLSGVECVVLDNTNTQLWEFADYLHLAALLGYEVEVVDLFDGGLSDEALAARNTHGVPLKSIQAMRARWEPYNKEN